jgi:hypothetical protein
MGRFLLPLVAVCGLLFAAAIFLVEVSGERPDHQQLARIEAYVAMMALTINLAIAAWAFRALNTGASDE